MKKRYLILSGMLVMLVVVLFILIDRRSEKLKPTNEAESLPLHSAISKTLKVRSGNANKVKQANNSSRTAATSELEKMIQATPDPAYSRYYLTQQGIDRDFDWKQPINFYGKVVDENDQSVQGAHVNFQWNDVSEKGTSNAETTSDSDGEFSLLDRKGKRLMVDVNKEGYYQTQAARVSAFEYANPFEGRFVPDANKPVVFHLKKKGQAEPLIHVKGQFIMSRNGAPIEVDLMTGKKVSEGQGDLKIQCWTFDNKKGVMNRFDWELLLTMLGGGLTESTKEFDFEAPVDGYRPSDDWKVPMSLEQKWSTAVEKNYSLRLKNGNYAFLKFKMIAGGSNYCRFECFVNPNGSRNLEFDPDKTINP